jgi:hypothetical protein
MKGRYQKGLEIDTFKVQDSLGMRDRFGIRQVRNQICRVGIR